MALHTHCGRSRLSSPLCAVLCFDLRRVLAERDVHGVDLRLVLLEQLRPLELERGREAVVFDVEALVELVEL